MVNGPTVRAEPTTLLVGQPALPEADGAENGGALRVEDYLHAIGELGRRRVDRVVGTLEAISGPIEQTVRALRAVAPHAQLVLVAAGDREPEAMRAVRLGFDDYIIQPVQPGEVAGAARAPADGRCARQGPGEAHPAAEGLAALEHVADEADSPPASDRSEMKLVDQLLTDREAVPEAALQTLRQRTGDAELTWCDQQPANGTSAPVRYGRQLLGYLASDRLGPGELAAHADWLARWLMLQRHVDRLSDMALRDELTGVWNRRYFERFLRSLLRRAQAERFRVTVLVYDIDDFKNYNDRFGHAAGDEILRETARLMSSLVRDHDVVARIGGDEFAVVFWDAEPPRRADSQHPSSVRQIAERFQRAVCEHQFPKLAERAPGTLTISGGLAGYPWDGTSVDQLCEAADRMLLESKQKGKDVLTFGPGALSVCGENDGMNDQ